MALCVESTIGARRYIDSLSAAGIVPAKIVWTAADASQQMFATP
jgi:hypothetical protein